METYFHIFWWIVAIMALAYTALGIYTLVNCIVFQDSAISFTQTYIAFFLTICAISFIILSHVDTTDFAYSIYYEDQVKELFEYEVKTMFKGMAKKEIAEYLCK